MTDLPYRIDTDGPVAEVTLARPDKRNALPMAFWDNFAGSMAELDASGDIRAVVLAGEGPHFCSGIDLAAFQDVAAARESAGAAAGLDFIDRVTAMQAAISSLEDARFPVIAAIQGACLGAGVDLVTACDIRLASNDARFSVYEIEIGMTADVGTFPRLLNHLPEGLVRELSYTGREMAAEEAARYGLVNRVYPDHGALLDGARALAREIATKAPMAVHGCKRAITYARDHTTRDSLEWIGIWNASMLQPSELAAAFAARSSGQPGNFARLPPRKVR
jgi:enoyl-CoA hydratase